jgi:hypothetical protein
MILNCLVPWRHNRWEVVRSYHLVLQPTKERRTSLRPRTLEVAIEMNLGGTPEYRITARFRREGKMNGGHALMRLCSKNINPDIG